MTLGLLGKQWFYFCFVLGNCSGNTVKVCMFHGSDCKTVVCPTITVSHSLFAHWKKRCGWFDQANANHDWLDCIVKQGGCLLVILVTRGRTSPLIPPQIADWLYPCLPLWSTTCHIIIFSRCHYSPLPQGGSTTLWSTLKLRMRQPEVYSSASRQKHCALCTYHLKTSHSNVSLSSWFEFLTKATMSERKVLNVSIRTLMLCLC